MTGIATQNRTASASGAGSARYGAAPPADFCRIWATLARSSDTDPRRTWPAAVAPAMVVAATSVTSAYEIVSRHRSPGRQRRRGRSGSSAASPAATTG